MFRWQIKGELVSGPRPRNRKNWAQQVPKSTVDKWVKNAKTAYGIWSVICLLQKRELRLYQQLPLDLLSYYRSCGLKVKHVPVKNGPGMFSRKKLKKVWKAYKQLPKPALVHCSAGLGRAIRASVYIKRKSRI